MPAPIRATSAAIRLVPTGTRLCLGCVALLVLTAPGVSVSRAQEFRVVTRVSRYLPEAEEWALISRSLTLFHAGKVYDKMEEVGEVVIFEPHQNRFVILNDNKMGCIVQTEELLQFLKVTRTEATGYLDELRKRQDQISQTSADALQFQLDPEFEQHFYAQGSLLKLTGQPLSYEVRTDRAEREQVAVTYLNYADWAARLNHILHPHSLYPASRLSLNQALRDRNLLPTEVNLRFTMPEENRLRAEHRYEWQLQSFDKTDIRTWEALVQSDEIRWLDFREYQRALLNRLADRR